jgi:hypothetical protein
MNKGSRAPFCAVRKEVMQEQYANVGYAGVQGAAIKGRAIQDPQPPSEVESELNALDNALQRLAMKREQLSQRLEPICRGRAPVGQTKAVVPVLGSQVARRLETLREMADGIAEAIEAEIQALAI